MTERIVELRVSLPDPANSDVVITADGEELLRVSEEVALDLADELTIAVERARRQREDEAIRQEQGAQVR